MCAYWLENWSWDCDCGLTGQARGGRQPWPEERLAAWRAEVLARWPGGIAQGRGQGGHHAAD
jgi:hypothetical protein